MGRFKVLFIHSSLGMGGVETFYLRMAKQRASEGKSTVIILLSNERRSDSSLLAEAKKYAKVLFLKDLTYLPNNLVWLIPFHLSLLIPLKTNIRKQLNEITHVHVSCGICAFFYAHLSKFVAKNVKFTIGLYHSLEFCWGGEVLPYFERKNRQLFFDTIDRKSIIFFNESMVPLYEKLSGQSFRNVNLFPLGVIEKVAPVTAVSNPGLKLLRLVSVGRLVAFKTYNLHMLDVVANLQKRGIPVVYDIYGDGPMQQDMKLKIDDYGLSSIVSLKGRLDYSLFSDVVSSYDIFIGSGTAIVQAAGLGVSAIVGIENVDAPETYGFLADLPGFSYNEDGLYVKKPITEVIEKFYCLDQKSRIKFSHKHVEKALEFSMEKCSLNFDNTPHSILNDDTRNRYSNAVFRLRYSASFIFTSFMAKLKGSSLSEQVRVNSARE
ncbi:hypothetical protein [Arsukibacterium perlucidum]|uniref:hypothetical protein n=1 Tax=Arsukibacterium perlucidum TaxID=368811 RepID=UPI00039E6726|nr:hypothetical protein [Arsukibacterium perlucidum]